MIVIIKQVNWTEKNLNWIFDFYAGMLHYFWPLNPSPSYHFHRSLTSWLVLCFVSARERAHLCAHGLIWAIVHYIIPLLFFLNFANVHRWNINILIILLLSIHRSLGSFVSARTFSHALLLLFTNRTPFGTLHSSLFTLNDDITSVHLHIKKRRKQRKRWRLKEEERKR